MSATSAAVSCALTGNGSRAAGGRAEAGPVDVHEQLRAKRFVLVDPRGRVRGWWSADLCDHVTLALADPQGQERTVSSLSVLGL